MTVSDAEEKDIPMAECGSCRAIIALDSKTCPECGISFSGVSEEALGECGACNSLVPLDSKSCPDCGVSFSGLNTDPMGECTACGAMNLLSSKQCWRCNIMFIGLDDVDGDGAVDLVAEDTSFSEEKKAAAAVETGKEATRKREKANSKLFKMLRFTFKVRASEARQGFLKHTCAT